MSRECFDKLSMSGVGKCPTHHIPLILSLSKDAARLQPSSPASAIRR